MRKIEPGTEWAANLYRRDPHTGFTQPKGVRKVTIADPPTGTINAIDAYEHDGTPVRVYRHDILTPWAEWKQHQNEKNEIAAISKMIYRKLRADAKPKTSCYDLKLTADEMRLLSAALSAFAADTHKDDLVEALNAN